MYGIMAYSTTILSQNLSFFAGDGTFKTGQHLPKLQTNVWLPHAPHSFCTFLLKDAKLAGILVDNGQNNDNNNNDRLTAFDPGQPG